jgi:hypothetical protein
VRASNLVLLVGVVATINNDLLANLDYPFVSLVVIAWQFSNGWADTLTENANQTASAFFFLVRVFLARIRTNDCRQLLRVGPAFVVIPGHVSWCSCAKPKVAS